MKARTLDCANVNKYVRPTIVRLNKAKAFLAVEPLHNACSHFPSPCWLKKVVAHTTCEQIRSSDVLGEKPCRAWSSRQPDSSNAVILSVFGKIDTRTISERRWRPPAVSQFRTIP